MTGAVTTPKALFFNVPAHGHVNPSLPLVTELTKRGHAITYFLTERFRARIEATGAAFQPYKTIGDDFFDGPGMDGTRPQLAAATLLSTAQQILPDLIAEAQARQADYILYDGMCPWGYFVARALKLPAVISQSLLVPTLGSMLNPAALRFVFSVLMTDFDKGRQATRLSQAIGRQYGVQPLSMMSALNAPGDLAICYTSAVFQPGAASVPKFYRFVGRVLPDSSTAPTPEGFSFEAAAGRPIVYGSLGTLVNTDESFFRACIEALGGRDVYVILSTGNGLAPERFGTLPPNIAIYNWVPQIDVLRRASLFITHAGLGSTLDGLYFGVPLLLIPQQQEQALTALRVAKLGAGLMLRKDQVSAATIRERAERLLADPRYKAEAGRIGDSFRAGGGVARAAELIEDLLRERTGTPA